MERIRITWQVSLRSEYSTDKIKGPPTGDEAQEDDQADRSALRSSTNQVSARKGVMAVIASAAFERGKRISDKQSSELANRECHTRAQTHDEPTLSGTSNRCPQTLVITGTMLHNLTIEGCRQRTGSERLRGSSDTAQGKHKKARRMPAGFCKKLLELNYSATASIERFTVPAGVMIVGFWNNEFAFTLR